MSSPDSITLPNGNVFLLRVPYSSREAHGVTVVVFVSCTSLVAVGVLLAAISLSASNTRGSLDRHLFVRTHSAAYFLCLLACNLSKALGSILNSRWITRMRVETGPVCTAQGVLQQASDVGMAIWTFAIAVHTFCLLVFGLNSSQFTFWATLLLGWCGTIAIVLAGPAMSDTTKGGEFFGISGYWCWISPQYPTQRITLDYLFIFMSALFSFILCALAFLYLRGNLILVNGWKLSFRIASAEAEKQHENDRSLLIARQMLWYPVAYTILIFPLVCTRLSALSGNEVPFLATIFSETVFLLFGIVNVVLFWTARHLLPSQSMSMLPGLSISRPRVVRPPSPRVYGSMNLCCSPTRSPEQSVVHLAQQSHHPESLLTESSSVTASIPYQHTVLPLEIRKAPHHGPPKHSPLQVTNPSRDIELDSVYDIYGLESDNGAVQGHEGDTADLYNISLR